MIRDFKRRAIMPAERAITAANAPFLVTLALALASLLWFIYLLMPVDSRIAADFKVFWTAGQIDKGLVYDFTAVTAAIPGETGLRPFVSPPTLLLAMKPVLGMPLGSGFVLWTAVGITFFCWISSRVAGKASILLVLAAPAVHWALIAGQVTLFVGALTYSGVLCLARRPAAAGLLFACAALLKPQAALLVPLALIAGGHYRALGAAMAVGSVAGLVSLSLQGPELWVEWLRAIASFKELMRSNGFVGKGITPSALAFTYQAQGMAEIAILWGGALLGSACCWLVFKRSDDAALRGGALVCGALLCTPYALPYEAASLLPVAAALLTRSDTRLAALLSAGLVACLPSSAFNVALFAVALIAAVLNPCASENPAGCRLERLKLLLSFHSPSQAHLRSRRPK